jgi:hypothetical protein
MTRPCSWSGLFNKSLSKEAGPLGIRQQFDSDKMTAWKVDKAVGNVKNDSPELIEPGFSRA